MGGEHILVIAIDGLRASALGAYGNTWYATRHLDRFAAESFLAEWCFASAVELPAIYRQLWHGTHPLRPPTHSDSSLSLPQRLANNGYQTRLVTDEPALTELSGADAFHEIVTVPAPSNSVADEIARTQLAAVFTALDLAAGDDPAPQLIWVHARGMAGPWDAPLELRHALADDDDPEPYLDAAPPDLWIDPAADPDARFRYACAYAAQIQVLDACVGALLDELHAPLGARFSTVIMGMRGYPLGEHQRVGGVDPRLHAEQLHVPLLVRTAGGAGRLHRAPELCEHADVAATISAWAAGNPSPQAIDDGLSLLPLIHGAPAPWRDHLVAANGSDDRAVRTAHWCWQRHRREDDVDDAEEHFTEQLFVRPDDRWETNDIAALCPDQVDGLRQAASDFEARCQDGEPLPPPELPPSLLED